MQIITAGKVFSWRKAKNTLTLQPLYNHYPDGFKEEEPVSDKVSEASRDQSSSVPRISLPICGAFFHGISMSSFFSLFLMGRCFIKYT